MKKTFAAIAAIAVLGLAVPALAATKTKSHATADTCSSYAKQLDDAISTHADAPKLNQAKKAKEIGDKDCGAKKFSAGVKQYKLGLRDLGVKPVRK